MFYLNKKINPFEIVEFYLGWVLFVTSCDVIIIIILWWIAVLYYCYWWRYDFGDTKFHFVIQN